jgi:hypothetical protein
MRMRYELMCGCEIWIDKRAKTIRYEVGLESALKGGREHRGKIKYQ